MDRFSKLSGAWTPLFFSCVVAGLGGVFLVPPGVIRLLAWSADDLTDADLEEVGLCAAAAWMGLVGCGWIAILTADTMRRRRSDRDAAACLRFLMQRDVGKTVIDLRRYEAQGSPIVRIARRRLSSRAANRPRDDARDVTTSRR